MAAGDYRSCDVCGGKCFYDANLNYIEGGTEWDPDIYPYRIAGDDQYDSMELLSKWGTRLDYVGDWAVICSACAKTHKCMIVKIDEGEPANDRA